MGRVNYQSYRATGDYKNMWLEYITRNKLPTSSGGGAVSLNSHLNLFEIKIYLKVDQTWTILDKDTLVPTSTEEILVELPYIESEGETLDYMGMKYDIESGWFFLGVQEGIGLFSIENLAERFGLNIDKDNFSKGLLNAKAYNILSDGTADLYKGIVVKRGFKEYDLNPALTGDFSRALSYAVDKGVNDNIKSLFLRFFKEKYSVEETEGVDRYPVISGKDRNAYTQERLKLLTSLENTKGKDYGRDEAHYMFIVDNILLSLITFLPIFRAYTLWDSQKELSKANNEMILDSGETYIKLSDIMNSGRYGRARYSFLVNDIEKPSIEGDYSLYNDPNKISKSYLRGIDIVAETKDYKGISNRMDLVENLHSVRAGMSIGRNIIGSMLKDIDSLKNRKLHDLSSGISAMKASINYVNNNILVDTLEAITKETRIHSEAVPLESTKVALNDDISKISIDNFNISGEELLKVLRRV